VIRNDDDNNNNKMLTFVHEKSKMNSDYSILTAFHGKGALRIIKWEDMEVSLA
jgi:hypothetical protein